MLRFFSPKTKMSWIPYKSKIIGISSFLYAIPFIWGAWPIYILQAFSSFMSDFVMTGNDSYWHPFDRLLATLNTIYVIGNSVLIIPVYYSITLTICSLSCYFVSTRFIKREYMKGYVFFHTLWHVTSSASISYVMYSACGTPIFNDDCKSKNIGFIMCNCIYSLDNKHKGNYSVYF